MATFEEKLAELMKHRGHSGNSLGPVAGVSGSTINNWVGSKGGPNLDQVRKLADHFGVTLDYLIRDEVTEKRQAEACVSEDELTILRVIRMLNLPVAEVLERIACRRGEPAGEPPRGPGSIGPIRDESEAAGRRQDDQGQGRKPKRADGRAMGPELTSRTGTRCTPARI